MKIGIFYLATSVYKNYFDNFRDTMHNLFPEDEKELILVSDGFKELDNTEINGFKVHVKEILDFPYPMVPTNKFQIVKTYMEQLNLEYGMFVDSDTICLEKPIEFWNSLKTSIMNGHLLMTKHPHYLYTPERDFYEPFIVSNQNSVGYMDAQYTNQNRCYIMTSFFCGCYNAIKRYSDIVYYMLGRDLDNLRWIPRFPDEAYMNKVYVMENILKDINIIDLRPFVTINPYVFGHFPERDNHDIHKNNFPEFDDSIFLNQKYDLTIKESKKSNQI